MIKEPKVIIAGKELSPEEASKVKIVGPSSTGNVVWQSQTEEAKETRRALKALWKKHDSTIVHTDKAILFERKFHKKIAECFEKTGVKLKVYERKGNSRLEIHRVGGTTIDALRKANQYYLALQRELEAKQGIYDLRDENIAYEYLWRKKHCFNVSYRNIAKDINYVVIDGLSKELSRGKGFSYSLYLVGLFLPEKKAKSLLQEELKLLKSGNSTFGEEYPISRSHVRDKLKWWGSTKAHQIFMKISGVAKTR